MDPGDLERAFALSADDRFGYFVRHAVESEAVWGLYEDGWAITANGDGQQAIPFWPGKELAEACATEAWAGYEAREISLPSFVISWLTQLADDGLRVAVFPVPAGHGVWVDPSFLMTAIRERLDPAD